MKRLILFLILQSAVTTLSVFGQPVSETSALKKAYEFLAKDGFNGSVLNRRGPSKKPQLCLANNRPEFYIFNDEANGGFVIVGGEERMPDILGYSYQGSYSDSSVPCNMQAWMECYAEQVNYLRSHPEATVKASSTVQRDRIEPMLTCAWSQRRPYNNQCPETDTGERCPTGCVATAMAQILYYYQWPQQTTDTIPTYELGIELGIPEMPPTKIDWGNILPYYGNSSYTESQADAVATLMRLCGAAMQMQYSERESGASTSHCRDAFYKYFGYSRALIMNSKLYSLDIWSQMLYDELANGYPVSYMIGGYKTTPHAVVLDGYDKDGYFYFNFGSGGHDVCYLLTEIDGYEKPGHEAIVNLRCLKPGETYFRGVIPNIYGVLSEDTVTIYGKEENGYSVRYYNYGELMEGLCDYYDNDDMYYCVLDPSISDCHPKDLSGFLSGNPNLISITGLDRLNTTEATTINGMFSGCSSLTNLDLRNYKTDKVTNMSGLFYGCNSLTDLDVSSFKTDNVTNMANMFGGCHNIKELDISNFKTSQVENLNCMFFNCRSLKTILVNAGWSTESVIDGTSIFLCCNNLVGGMGTKYLSFMDSPTRWKKYACIDGGINHPGLLTDKAGNRIYGDLNHNKLTLCFDTEIESHSNVVLTLLDSVSKICIDHDVSECVFDESFTQRPIVFDELAYLFNNCDKLQEIRGLEHLNTDNATSMRSAFSGCSSLTNLDLSHFNTANVTDMTSMFSNCSALTSLDLSNFNTGKVTSTEEMFSYNTELNTIYVSDKWNMESVERSNRMFRRCLKLIGGKGTKYDYQCIDKTYARIDGGTEAPGYFTYKESTDIKEPIKYKNNDTPIYRLSGVKSNQLGKGVNIIGGKKFVVRP